MKKSILFIGIFAVFLGIVLMQNIEPSHLQGSSFVDEKENASILPFSIEPTLSDKTISLIFGGNISLKKEKQFIIPEFLQKIFGKQDAVILHLQNQVFNEEITDIKESPIIEKEFLETLKKWNISSLTVFSNALYSRGKFFADLTFGNIIESSIQPIVSQYPQYVKKGNLTIAILSINIERENSEEFRKFITQQKKENNFVIVLADNNSPTLTTVSESTKKSFHSFIKSGADVVLGMGNENILPIEHYENKIIAYSLGTFYSDEKALFPIDEKQNGIMAEIIISPINKRIYIHPFSFHQKSFSFFSEIETLEFFSDENNFLDFSKDERKKLLDDKIIEW